MPAPTRVRPAAPAMRCVPGLMAVRKKTFESGSKCRGCGQQHGRDDQRRRWLRRRPASGSRPRTDGDTPASGAERHADGDFAAARDRFGDEKVREVHARDQQHESDGAEDDERDTAKVGVDARVIQRPGRGACALSALKPDRRDAPPQPVVP